MTTLTTTTPAHVAGDHAEPAAVREIRRLAGPVALVSGSLIGVIAMALHQSGADDSNAAAELAANHPSQWIAAHLLLTVGWAVLGIGIASVIRLARARGATLTVLGTAVATLGAGLMSLADVTHGVVQYALGGQLPTDQSVAIQTAYFHHPIIGIMMMAGMLLPAGLIVLGIGLLQSRAVPVWAAVLLIASPIAIQAAGAAGVWETVAGIPLLASCTVLARAVARA
jgi:hypothetical protein